MGMNCWFRARAAANRAFLYFPGLRLCLGKRWPVLSPKEKTGFLEALLTSSNESDTNI
jgi:hypothetical protein